MPNSDRLPDLRLLLGNEGSENLALERWQKFLSDQPSRPSKEFDKERE
jgi:hypothetical protein